MNQWKIRELFSSLALHLFLLAVFLPIASSVLSILILLFLVPLSSAFDYNLLPPAGYLFVALSLVLFGLNIRILFSKGSPVPLIGGGLAFIGLVLGASGDGETLSSMRSLPFILTRDYCFPLVYLLECSTYSCLVVAFWLFRKIIVAIFSCKRRHSKFPRDCRTRRHEGETSNDGERRSEIRGLLRDVWDFGIWIEQSSGVKFSRALERINPNSAGSRVDRLKDICYLFYGGIARNLVYLVLALILSCVLATLLGLLVGVLSFALRYNLFPEAGHLFIALSLALFGLNIAKLSVKDAPFPLIGGALMAIGLYSGTASEITNEWAGISSSISPIPFLPGYWILIIVWLFEISTYSLLIGIIQFFYRIIVLTFSLLRK